MAGIFVSYRRDDSQGFAGRLADDLTEMFGAELVFRDIEIPPGSDFTDVLHRAIAASDILLVVIGRQWAPSSTRGLASRLFEATDWVRTEVEAALAQGKQLIPVLVGGARMPGPDDLPQSIAKLAWLQAVSMSDRHWDTEIEQLGEHLRGLCPALAERRAEGDREVTPADVLREFGERFIEQVASRRRPHLTPPDLSQTYGQSLLQSLGRGLRRFLSSVVLLALVYAGLRLFGDQQILEMLDAFEARLLVGLERLRLYLQSF